MIDVKSISKRYRKKLVVDNLTFQIKTGSITGFLGPNGAGKSTTMRLMLGLDKGSGATTFDGKRLYEYDNPSSVVGVLLEAKAFHPTRSARNHLKVLAAASNLPYSRVDEVLSIVGLSDVAKKSPGKFSLGMSQRLGIAAAILGNPKYLLLDEPANGLDPEGIAWLRKFIKEYAAAGNAVFVSSHLLSEMAQMADNIIVIGKGKMIANSSMSDLLNQASGDSVFVRTSKPKALEKTLADQKITYKTDAKGITVHGKSTDVVGKLAFAANAPILELKNHQTTLEEAFLGLTENATEYQAHTERPKKEKS